MNKFIIALILVVTVGSIWYWYDNRDSFVIDEPTPSATVQPESSSEPFDATDGTYRLDPNTSSMTWKGSRPLLDNYFDSGSIALASGEVVVSGGEVASGTVVVDMTSISASQTGSGAGMDRLSQHLMGEDFFDAEIYSTSSFRLTNFERRDDGGYLVSGELTIKETTKSISFVASVSSSNGSITLSAEDVQVDRTLWDITYGSGSFFDDVGDKLIDDIFTVSFSVVGVLEK